jgi:hypothetical protein
VEEKVFSTTYERKVMSKTTFFKRIAMTAIAALGFGMLSVAPSNATVESNTLAIDSATDAISVGETATAVITHKLLQGVAGDSSTVRAVLTTGNAGAGTLAFIVTDSYTASVSDDPTYTSVAAVAGTNSARADTDLVMARNTETGSGVLNSSSANAQASRGPIVLGFRHANNPDSFTVSNGTGSPVITTVANLLFVAPQAGTYVITVSSKSLNTTNTNSYAEAPGGSLTWTVTVTAPDEKPTSYTSVVRTGTATGASGTSLATDSSTTASSTSSSVAPKFTVWTNLNNTKGEDSSDNAIDSMTVTVTGEAYISADSGNQASGTGTTSRGTLRALTLNTDAAPDADGTPLYVWSTGTAGTATVTFTAINSGLTWTKTFTFYGSGSKIAVGSSIYKIARAGGFTTSSMFTVTLKDSADRAVPGQSLSVEVDNNTILASGSCADAVGLVTDGTYACSVTTAVGSTSGQSGTLTVIFEDAAGTEFSTTYTVSLGGGVSTVVLTTDKASYEPGEKMVVTATAKDASGNPVYDGLAGPTLTVNKAIGGTLAMNVYNGGVSTSQTRSSTTGLVTAADTLYAPAASGKFRVSGLAGDAASTPISVEATVTDDGATAAANAASDAAAEAIDAANAATDAANLAAEAADAATVAAEEARDAADAATAAVEELATQVATLMAALKAQITTLANTVAKIAKKVRA